MHSRSLRPVRVLVGLVIVLAALVSACAPAATQAPAQPAAGAKWCSGVKIVFFPGGPEGGVFAVNVYNGAKQAESDLGASVQYVWSGWDPQKMIQQFQESAATKPDGIAVTGHPGDEAFDTLIDAREEGGLTVDYLEIDSATNSDPVAGAPTFTGYVSSHPDVKLVVTDHGGLTATAQTYLTSAGKQPGEIAIAGFDLSPATIAAIKGGWTGLVIDQQEWLQGYLPILQICLTKVYGFSGLYINTGAGFVDKSNVDSVAPLAEKNIR